MKLPKAFLDDVRGVVLIQVVLAFSLLVAFSTAVLPVSLRGMYAHQRATVTDTILITLRSAQAQAMQGHYGETHGVKFFNDRLVLFVGDSFAARDIVHDVLVPAGPFDAIENDEVVFASGSGLPYEGVTIVLVMYGDTLSFHVSPLGLISN